MGLVMQSNGDDPTKVDPAAFDKAIGTLQDAVDSGQIRRFTGNDYGDDLSSGNVAAAMAGPATSSSSSSTTPTSSSSSRTPAG